MLQELVIAIMLGLVGGVIPGPVITSVFTEILQSGLPGSIRIILIALVTETLVAIASLLLLDSFHFHEAFFRGLSLVGAAVLVWIATTIYRIRRLDTGNRVHFSTGKIVVMILTNGVLWTYWITVCIPKAILLGNKLPMGEYLFMGLVQLGWLISTMAVAFLFSRFRTLLSGLRVIPVLFKIFAGAFVYFAAEMVYHSIRYFTH